MAPAPFPPPSVFGLERSRSFVSRNGSVATVDPVREAFTTYWELLKTVVADLEITEEELVLVQSERVRSGLKDEQVRVLHARAFASVIQQFTSDQWVDDREVRKLRRLHQCLSKLGWAPGE